MLNILDEKEPVVEYANEDIVSNQPETEELKFFLVGFFLTDSRIPYEIMCDTLSSLWKSSKGLCTCKVPNDRFSFQFFHKLNFRRIVDGGPWTFKNHLLV